MARVILMNIEATRALMEDGESGYVLQTADQMHLVCQKRDGNRLTGPLRRDTPQSDDVAVYTTHARAVTAQRWWNDQYPDDKVAIVLRREALGDYIAKQQQAHDILLSLIELEKQQ
jgi:hypothetical protein